MLSMISYAGEDGYHYYYFFPEKTGKTSITTKAKNENSKRIFTITKYVNPVSSIKIGNTLVITPKKGWEVCSICVLNKSGSKTYQSLSPFDKNSIKPIGGKGNHKLSIEFLNSVNGGMITEEIVFK